MYYYRIFGCVLITTAVSNQSSSLPEWGSAIGFLFKVHYVEISFKLIRRYNNLSVISFCMAHWNEYFDTCTSSFVFSRTQQINSRSYHTDDDGIVPFAKGLVRAEDVIIEKVM